MRPSSTPQLHQARDCVRPTGSVAATGRPTASNRKRDHRPKTIPNAFRVQPVVDDLVVGQIVVRDFGQPIKIVVAERDGVFFRRRNRANPSRGIVRERHGGPGRRAGHGKKVPVLVVNQRRGRTPGRARRRWSLSRQELTFGIVRIRIRIAECVGGGERTMLSIVAELGERLERRSIPVILRKNSIRR